MADTHETIADIIAEMRQGMNPNGTAECQYLESDICMLADRLEAAHKRERGDAAKLREALEKVRHLMPYFLQYMRLRWEDAGGGGYYESINKTIDAALAAPARNCDVYNNESCRMAYHLNGDGLMTMQAFADWLFAPATEKEGGNDGNE